MKERWCLTESLSHLVYFVKMSGNTPNVNRFNLIKDCPLKIIMNDMCHVDSSLFTWFLHVFICSFNSYCFSLMEVSVVHCFSIFIKLVYSSSFPRGAPPMGNWSRVIGTKSLLCLTAPRCAELDYILWLVPKWLGLSKVGGCHWVSVFLHSWTSSYMSDGNQGYSADIRFLH